MTRIVLFHLDRNDSTPQIPERDNAVAGPVSIGAQLSQQVRESEAAEGAVKARHTRFVMRLVARGNVLAIPEPERKHDLGFVVGAEPRT